MAPGSNSVLLVDGDLPRNAGVRRIVDVAVGLLFRPDGRFLLCTRPPGKAYAGYWEFPGGKVEGGEDVITALRRELTEEIGVEVLSAHLWQVLVVDYPHALVRLHFCNVESWNGDPQMLEGQEFSWESHPVQQTPILPGTVPVLAWMQSNA